MALYDDDGEVRILYDLPTALVKRVRRQARKVGTTLPALLIRLLQAKIDEAQRGF